jgi:hypothetical protein
MKPTPHLNQYACPDCGVLAGHAFNCRKTTSEEKCKHPEGYTTMGTTTGRMYCAYCREPEPSPSPEARVDWKKEARRIYPMLQTDSVKDDIEQLAKALSAAFEKGREAR